MKSERNLNLIQAVLKLQQKYYKIILLNSKKVPKNNKSGPGFEKSDLYTGAKISILDKKDLVNINFKDWLVLSMCAIWNSGIEVIYAKDRIGKKNYPNAWYHAMHSFVLHPYLPELVNE